MKTIVDRDWFSYIKNQLENERYVLLKSKWGNLLEETQREADELFRFLFSYVQERQQKDLSVNDIGRYQYRWDGKQENQHKWNVMKDMVSRLSFNFRDLIHLLSMVKGFMERAELDFDYLEEIQHSIERLQAFIDDLEELFLIDDDRQVKWIEIEAYGARNAVYLFSEPIDISNTLKESLFDSKDSIILTSATLTMNHSFSFIKQRLGMDEAKLMESKLDSPFDYKHQVQLLVPSDFPKMEYRNNQEYIYATCEAILSLAEVTNGRMLVLFTSYDMLKQSYGLLREMMDEDNFMIIAQGISSGSRSRLKKNFQAFNRAIMLGTSSFWEGVDIPGSDLSCLVIVRLPFQPPDHPIYDAKSTYLKQEGKNPFMELALPNAVIRFKQGFGRLIRSGSDRGIVFICDDRVIKARYGKFFINSIPEVPITYNNTHKLIQKAQDWL